jgi:hypothetical protein
MTYPDGIDALINVNAGDTLAAGGHAARHNSVNTALVEIKNMLGPSPAGKIMQIVRATDSTQRSTTSLSFVDVTGMSVTITPQKSDSVVLVIATAKVEIQESSGGNPVAEVQITDSSNNALAGTEASRIGVVGVGVGGLIRYPMTIVGYASPATTSPVTYKLRALTFSGRTIIFENAVTKGQMYAIEVSA